MKPQSKPREFGTKIAPDEIMAQYRAKSYSAKIKRRREITSTAIRHGFFTGIAVLTVGLFAYGFHTGVVRIPKGEEVATETETETEIIRDKVYDDFVVEDYEDEITTPIEIMPGVEYYDGVYFVWAIAECDGDTFNALLPTNGSWQTFNMVDNPPIDDFGNPYFEVCIFIVDEEDFETENYSNWIVISAY